MASRPVFHTDTSRIKFKPNVNELVQTTMVDFEWHKGFAISQKQKSIVSLHSSTKNTLNISNILEISTKSLEPLGVSLSAFNLSFMPKSKNRAYSIESIFQSSKVFENGGPYSDILEYPSIQAKQDKRLKDSGKLCYFEFENFRWDLDTKTAFYDWLYINALSLQNIKSELIKYSAFTDIEFNPKKSYNCQAYSAALFVALSTRNILDKYTSSPKTFLSLYSFSKVEQLLLL